MTLLRRWAASIAAVLLPVAALAPPAAGQTVSARSGNPIIPGWYADPEAHVFAGQYWIYPTTSAPYDQQTFLDAFSSPNLVTWTRHAHVLDVSNVTWARRAVWAPSIIEKDGWYYLFFGANDIQNDRQVGGIGAARARSPDGPFKDYLGHPLIGAFHNGAQPIDPFVFKDTDGTYYMTYGGWGHCNIAKFNPDLTGFVPFDDGTTFKEITPKGYVEGSYMLLEGGKYYFMWSEGGWTGPNYAVAYAVGTSALGPFERVGRILQQDSSVATGAGHHSVLRSPSSGKWYIVYHRRPLGETDRNHRVVAIDELRFDDRGSILPVHITREGVAADPVQAGVPAGPSPAPGRDVLQRMHDAYAGKWYSTLRFVQKTTRYGNDGTPTFATWYESLRQTADGRTQLRIDLGPPTAGNGVLYTADSSWVFRGGKLAAARAGGNEFLQLIEGVYMQPVDATIRQIASTNVDLSRVAHGVWEGRPATVIGVATVADSVSPQIWVDDQRNVVVRMLLRPTPSSPPMDIHLGDYVKVGDGWLATKVAMTVDGKPAQTEDYADWKVGMALAPDLFSTNAWIPRAHWALR